MKLIRKCRIAIQHINKQSSRYNGYCEMLIAMNRVTGLNNFLLCHFACKLIHLFIAYVCFK